MKGALNDGTDALTAAVRDEVWQSLEPVRQLPQMLAAATPVMPVDKGMVRRGLFYFFVLQQ